MKNKKLIFGAVGVIIAVLLIVPGVLGGKIEQQTVAYFKNIYKTASNQEVAIIYDKGWFSSTAIIEFNFPKNYLKSILENPDNLENLDDKQQIIIQVNHGPVIFPKFSLGWASFSSEGYFFPFPIENLKPPYDAIPPYNFDGIINFDGSVNSVFGVPSFEISLADVNGLSEQDNEANSSVLGFDEIRFETETILENGELRLTILPGNFHMFGIDPTGKKFEFNIEEIAFDGVYLTEIPYPINIDRGAISIKRIDFNIEGKSFLMEGIKTADLIERNTETPLLDYKSQFQFGPLGYFSEKDKNPIPQVISTEGSAEILNINGDAIVELFDTLVDMPENPSEEETAKLMAIGEDILASGLEYNLPNLEVHTQWGNVHYTQQLVFPTLDLSNTFEPQAFLGKIYFLGNFGFDPSFVEAMVEKTIQSQMETLGQEVDEATFESLKANTIQQFVTAGYLVLEEDGSFTSTLEIKDGVLFINGTPMDLMQALEMAS